MITKNSIMKKAIAMKMNPSIAGDFAEFVGEAKP